MRGRIGRVDASLIFSARALVLADLQARHRATAEAVSVLEDAMSQRTWWAEQWPEGEKYVAGLVAQDVQDALFESVGRWPVCVSLPLPGITAASMVNSSPPTSVHARPVTCPTWSFSSARP